MRLHAFACQVRGSAGLQTIQVLQVGGITPAVCTCGVVTVQPAVGEGRLVFPIRPRLQLSPDKLLAAGPGQASNT